MMEEKESKKVGKWIYDGDQIICNKCYKAYDILNVIRGMKMDFCPNCNVKMEENKEDK